MVFEGQDVPLTEDVIKQRPREFFPTLSELAADTKLQIVELFSQAGTGSGTLFTVPENNTFFMTGINLSGSNTAVAGSGFVGIESARFGNMFRIRVAFSQNNSLSQNFSMPLKFNAGEIILFEISGASVIGDGSIYGFVVPKEISLRSQSF
tara:strand:+ start:2128 stop:2580 length:453 start_codon:yes stop_codon:yes gene_type:complete